MSLSLDLLFHRSSLQGGEDGPNLVFVMNISGTQIHELLLYVWCNKYI